MLVLAQTAAVASVHTDHRGDKWVLIDPPAAWFDVKFHGSIEIFLNDQEEIESICSESVGKAERFGCSLVSPTECFIYIAEEIPGPFRRAITQHELAHCNGWPADHPLY